MSDVLSVPAATWFSEAEEEKDSSIPFTLLFLDLTFLSVYLADDICVTHAFFSIKAQVKPVFFLPVFSFLRP
jgi:hypothetical protein